MERSKHVLIIKLIIFCFTVCASTSGATESADLFKQLQNKLAIDIQTPAPGTFRNPFAESRLQLIVNQVIERVLGDARFQANPGLYLEEFRNYEHSTEQLDVIRIPETYTKEFLEKLRDEFTVIRGMTCDVLLRRSQPAKFEIIELKNGNRLHEYARIARQLNLTIPAGSEPLFPF